MRSSEQTVVIPLGTRGWMPQDGRQTVCIFVKLGDIRFLLDCGMGARSTHKGRHTKVDEHLTPAHQQVAGWSVKRLLDWAQDIGCQTHATVEAMLGSRQHPQQSYRACLGVLRMSKTYGNARLEAACDRALRLNATNYRSLGSHPQQRAGSGG